MPSLANGLSPRVRGNLLVTVIASSPFRSIPACAGEPGLVQLFQLFQLVYPRVCGGTPLKSHPPGCPRGLSPRVRGNRASYDDIWKALGSIPACAGEPHIVAAAEAVFSVYPRVCGGTHRHRRARLRPAGLSPRVRGNHMADFKPITVQRSIPACAGEPLCPRRRILRHPVYPRVCGGTSCARPSSNNQSGLSPRVRGNPVALCRAGAGGGSIPACAGEPPDDAPAPAHSQVYPRVCGGTWRPACGKDEYVGLSPRVRGNPIRVIWGAISARSIPACAGEPSQRPNPPRLSPVYPRVCGGTGWFLFSTPTIVGLSPRVRGNQLPVHGYFQLVGSIPACAGEPVSAQLAVAVVMVYPRVCGGTE